MGHYSADMDVVLGMVRVHRRCGAVAARERGRHCLAALPGTPADGRSWDVDGDVPGLGPQPRNELVPTAERRLLRRRVERHDESRVHPHEDTTDGRRRLEEQRVVNTRLRLDRGRGSLCDGAIGKPTKVEELEVLSRKSDVVPSGATSRSWSLANVRETEARNGTYKKSAASRMGGLPESRSGSARSLSVVPGAPSTNCILAPGLLSGVRLTNCC